MDKVIAIEMLKLFKTANNDVDAAKNKDDESDTVKMSHDRASKHSQKSSHR